MMTDTAKLDSSPADQAPTIRSPTPQEIKVFLEDYKKISEFEMIMRTRHNFSAYTKEEVEKFPNPAVAAVIEWLKTGSAR